MLEDCAVADRDIITPFQGLLRSKDVLDSALRECIKDRLSIDRTTVYAWSKGRSYPNKENADKLIELFREHGITLDYNQIYQASVNEGCA